MEKVFTVLGWIAGATLAIAIARQLSEQKIIDSSLFAPAALFHNEHFMDLNPASFTLDKVRDPYALLKGVLPVKTSSKTSDLTAQTCFQTDFLAQNQKIGNFNQYTNNYKRKVPDSCSAPLTELVNTVY
jgi:hypothetical protein